MITSRQSPPACWRRLEGPSSTAGGTPGPAERPGCRRAPPGSSPGG
ncbi:hypothetical protein ATKI12_5183 [Kitasatospora sp. Ki12]